MSERGSFVTQFMYCDECLKRMKKVLIKNHKYLKGVQIEGWKGRKKKLPIIAGKIGGLYGGEELCEFQFNLFNEKNAPCHSVVIAVIPDAATGYGYHPSLSPELFVVLPDGNVECYGDWKKNRDRKED